MKQWLKYSIIPITLIANRIRGQKKFVFLQKQIAYAAMALPVALYTWDFLLGISVFGSLWFWGAFGWGAYFAAFHGRWIEGDDEIVFIDRIAMKLSGIDDRSAVSAVKLRKWGTWAMALRGGVFFIPVVLAFVIRQQDYTDLFMLPWGFMQGLIYAAVRYIPEESKLPVPIAECVMGAWIGLGLYIMVD